MYFPQVHVVQQEGKLKGERLVAMKGAPERIIARCSEVQLGDRVVPMTPELMAEIEAHQETLSRNGLRVLGCVRALLEKKDTKLLVAILLVLYEHECR